MAALDDVNEVAQAFLDASIAALEVTDAGPPGRAFVSPGRPALDCCGQLTVWVSAITEAATVSPPGGFGDSRRQKIGSIPTLTVHIQATRCGPTLNQRGDPPPPADLDASAKQVQQDVWALWIGLADSLRDGDLSRVCAGAWRDGATAIEPQGGCVGWELVYRYPIQAGRFGT